MDVNDYLKTLANNIYNLRKESGLTQENLAEKLNISFQAVSKWENGQTSPDIIMLPLLAQVFNVSIDELFGRERDNNAKNTCSVNWDDDDTIRGVIYKGRKLLSKHEDLSKFTFEIEGNALNVEAGCDINCGNVEGDVNAGGYVNCGNVEGDVNAGGYVNCGNVEGDVNAGGYVNCGDVEGDVSAGSDINCGDIGGNASAGCDITCDNNIKGNVIAGGDVTCK
jgi:transcriptional regulator with XRE-family HTH domain